MRTTIRGIAAVLLAGTAVAATAGVGTGTAEAKSPPQRLQVEQTLFTGDPWPVGYQTFSVSTAAPGKARIAVDRLCNSFQRGLCLPYTRGGAVFWFNTATGRSGNVTIRDGADPGTAVNAVTGSGGIVIRVGSAGPANTIVPAYGFVRVG